MKTLCLCLLSWIEFELEIYKFMNVSMLKFMNGHFLVYGYGLLHLFPPQIMFIVSYGRNTLYNDDEEVHEW